VSERQPGPSPRADLEYWPAVRDVVLNSNTRHLPTPSRQLGSKPAPSRCGAGPARPLKIRAGQAIGGKNVLGRPKICTAPWKKDGFTRALDARLIFPPFCERFFFFFFFFSPRDALTPTAPGARQFLIASAPGGTAA